MRTGPATASWGVGSTQCLENKPTKYNTTQIEVILKRRDLIQGHAILNEMTLMLSHL